MARAARTNPRALAEGFLPHLRTADVDGLIEKVDVAGPGFINIRLSQAGWSGAIADAIGAAQSYGQCNAGRSERVLLEFVSANPTGPLHVGHGRGAIFGDALARVMRAAGYEVDTEYYINNVGNQIAKLGESVWHWVRCLSELSAEDRQQRITGDLPELPKGFPEDGYRGGYIAEIALALVSDDGPDLHLGLDAPSWQDSSWWDDKEQGGARSDNREVATHAW
ncbi:MAG TPA: arginine--tRNA ligase [Myxococcales bacterium]|nr:arginine--tRNA ligase [Myxococcales bacterium]